jgi:hypothetical protein
MLPEYKTHDQHYVQFSWLVGAFASEGVWGTQDQDYGQRPEVISHTHMAFGFVPKFLPTSPVTGSKFLRLTSSYKMSLTAFLTSH